MSDLNQIITKSISILSKDSYKQPKCFKYQLQCKDRESMKTWKVGLVRAALVSTITRMKKNIGIIKNVQSVKNGIIAYVAENFTNIHIKVRGVNASFTLVCAPSEVIIKNIHPTTSNVALEEVFNQLGTVSNFRRSKKNNQVAVLKFSSYINEETKRKLCEIRYPHHGESHTIRLQWKKPQNILHSEKFKKNNKDQLEKDDCIDEVMEDAEDAKKSEEHVVEERRSFEANCDSSNDKVNPEDIEKMEEPSGDDDDDLPALVECSDPIQEGAVNLDVIAGIQEDGIPSGDLQQHDEELEVSDSKQRKFVKRKHTKAYQRYVENVAELINCPDWILWEDKQSLLHELTTGDLDLLADSAKQMYDYDIGYEDTDTQIDMLNEMELELLNGSTGKRGREHKTKKGSLTPPQPKRACEGNEKGTQKSHNKSKNRNRFKNRKPPT